MTTEMKIDKRVYLRIRGLNGDTHTPIVINNDSERFRKQSISAINKLLRAIPQAKNQEGLNFAVYAQDLPYFPSKNDFDEMGDRDI